MKEPKFKFGTTVTSITGEIFTVFKIEYSNEFRYYVSDTDDSYWTEDCLEEYVPSVELTRDKLLAAWQFANDGVTWRNSNDASLIQGLLKYFGFEEIK